MNENIILAIFWFIAGEITATFAIALFLYKKHMDTDLEVKEEPKHNEIETLHERGM